MAIEVKYPINLSLRLLLIILLFRSNPSSPTSSSKEIKPSCSLYFLLNSTCIPYCPSGYSESYSSCELKSKEILSSCFLPVHLSSLNKTWKTLSTIDSQNLWLTQTRGLYSKSKQTICSKEKFSFGGFASFQIWFNSFKSGIILSNSELTIEIKDTQLIFSAKMLRYQYGGLRDIDTKVTVKEGWNFVNINILQESTSDIILKSSNYKQTFPDTVFFINKQKLELGGFEGFIFKLGIFNSEITYEVPEIPECPINKYIQDSLCIECPLESNHSDCILFKEENSHKPRIMPTCYNYKSLTCISTCPTGYLEDESSGNCTLNVNVPYEISFHAPISKEFSDSTGTIVFSASYQLNAYQRGLYFNSSYGKLEGNQVQISLDFELLLFILPYSLNSGLLLSKITSPNFSLNFQSADLILKLGSTSLTIDSSYFTADSWTYIFIHIETAVVSSAAQFTVSGSINENSLTPVTALDMFIDTESKLYFSYDLSFTGFLYQLVYAPDIGMVSTSSYISTTCNQACSLCPASDNECLSTCELDQYFDNFLNCNDCIACEICIRENSCGLNIDPLCKIYTKYDECEVCKDFSSLDNSLKCTCINGTTFDSELEICCSDMCSECKKSEVFCQSCKDVSFEGLCLSNCPTLTSLTGSECEVTDGDSKISFKFEVAGNYVKDSSVDPIDDYFFTEYSRQVLNPFIEYSDPYPGKDRGLYFLDSFLELQNFYLSPVHTWLTWVKISDYGVFMEKGGFLILLNNFYVKFSYNTSTSLKMETEVSVSLPKTNWYLIYLSTSVSTNITTIRLGYNKQSASPYSPDPSQYVADKSSSLYIGKIGFGSEVFNGWLYRLDYFIYYLPFSDTENQYQIIFTLGECSYWEYEDENGDCNSCLAGCKTCINDYSCLVCSDILCYSCYDFYTTDCTKCPYGKVFREIDNFCDDCPTECKTCWRTRVNSCYECNDGYFMSNEGICVENCPSNFKATTGKCVKVNNDDYILSFKFNRISDPVYEPIFNFALNLGFASIYEPDSVNEPLFLTYRGLYFRENAFASLGEDFGNPDKLILGNSHTIEFWIMPFSSADDGEVIELYSSLGTNIKLIVHPVSGGNYEIYLSIYLTGLLQDSDSGTSEVSSSEISYNAWVKVSIMLIHSNSNIIISLYLNNQIDQSELISLSYFKEFIDSTLRIGNSGFKSFLGYLYLFEMLSTNINLKSNIKCSCPICTQYGDCLIPCFNLEYWSGSECKSCKAECTLGCTRAENCVLHPDNLCKYFDLLEKGSCWNCVSLAKNTKNCECVNHSSSLSDYSECICNENYRPEDSECGLCYLWIKDIKSSYLDSFESILFEFDEAVYNNSLKCEDIFDGNSIKEFGNGYSCEFINDSKELILNLGWFSTIVYGTINFRYKVLYSPKFDCLSYPSPLKSVLSSTEVPKTKAIHEYPEILFFECEDLIIDGSMSLGSVRRKMFYKWTVSSEPYNSKISEFSTDFVEDSLLVIPRTNLFTCNITVSLTVKNAFGDTSIYSGLVQSVVYSDKMLVFYDKRIDYYFMPNVDNYFDFFVRKCELIDDIEIKWNLVNVAKNTSEVNITKLWKAQKRNGQLFIPSNTFVPYSEIDFESFIDNNTETVLARSSINILALPTYPQIFVDIANGTISSSYTLQLNVSIYYEYNIEEIFDLNWTCTVNNQNCLVDIRDDLSLSFESNKLIPNKNYILQLYYRSRQVEGVSGILRSVELNTIKDQSPIVNIFEKVSRLQPQILNVDSPSIALETSIKYSSFNFSYYWSIVSDTPLELKNVKSSVLIIDTQYLIPGSYYKLNLKLSSDEFEGNYFYEFTVNIPPIVERLQVTPKVGIEFSTIFKLQAINTYDDDFNYPLKYVFGFYINNQQIMMNLKNQSLVYWTDLPYISGTLKVFVKAYDSLNSSSETSGVVFIAYNEKFSGRLYFDQMKKNFGFSFFDLQTTSGFLTLLSTGILNRDLYIRGLFSKNTVEKQELIQECFEFCVQALIDMMDAIPNYDEQGISAVSKAIELLSLNPNLETLENTELLCPIIKQFLEQSSSIAGISEINLKNFVGACFNVAPLNSSLIFDNQQIFSELVKLSNTGVLEYLKQVKGIEGKKVDLKGEEYIIKVIEYNREENLALSSQLYGSKIEFSQEINEFLNGNNMHLSLLTIPQEANSNFYKNSIFTKPSVIDVTLFIDFNYTAITTDKELLKVHIPVFNMSSEYVPICIYLDLELKEWSKKGCNYLSKTNSTVICICSHLSSFSVTDFFKEGGATLTSSNINTAFDYNLFNDLNSINASGLYFFSSIIVVYLFLAYFVRKIDLKLGSVPEITQITNNNSENLCPANTARNLNEILTYKENNLMDLSPRSEKSLKSEENEKVSEEFCENSKRVNSEEFKMDSIEDCAKEKPTPECENVVIVKMKKSKIRKFLENSSKDFKSQIIEAHELFKLIYRPIVFETRLTLLTLLYIKILLQVFLIGLFYKDKSTKEELKYASLNIAFIEYSVNDFWIMVYSTVISLVVMILPTYLLSYKKKENKFYPFIFKTLPWNIKIRRISGYIIGAAIIFFCGLSISLFSINFTAGTKNIWIVGTIISVILEIFVVSILKESAIIFLKRKIAQFILKRTFKSS